MKLKRLMDGEAMVRFPSFLLVPGFVAKSSHSLIDRSTHNFIPAY
jgi:hypothetical protein